MTPYETAVLRKSHACAEYLKPREKREKSPRKTAGNADQTDSREDTGIEKDQTTGVERSVDDETDENDTDKNENRNDEAITDKEEEDKTESQKEKSMSDSEENKKDEHQENSDEKNSGDEQGKIESQKEKSTLDSEESKKDDEHQGNSDVKSSEDKLEGEEEEGSACQKDNQSDKRGDKVHEEEVAEADKDTENRDERTKDIVTPKTEITANDSGKTDPVAQEIGGSFEKIDTGYSTETVEADDEGYQAEGEDESSINASVSGVGLAGTTADGTRNSEQCRISNDSVPTSNDKEKQVDDRNILSQWTKSPETHRSLHRKGSDRNSGRPEHVREHRQMSADREKWDAFSKIDSWNHSYKPAPNRRKTRRSQSLDRQSRGKTNHQKRQNRLRSRSLDQLPRSRSGDRRQSDIRNDSFFAIPEYAARYDILSPIQEGSRPESCRRHGRFSSQRNKSPLVRRYKYKSRTPRKDAHEIQQLVRIFELKTGASSGIYKSRKVNLHNRSESKQRKMVAQLKEELSNRSANLKTNEKLNFRNSEEWELYLQGEMN